MNNKIIVELSVAEYREMDENGGGVCLACGEEAYGVEPDARNYKCEVCGKNRVFGIAEALLMGRVHIMSRTTSDLMNALREAAPGIAFSVSGELDPYFVWDGNGDDPADDGMCPVDVDFRAVIIINGVEIEGTSSLGGHYVNGDLFNGPCVGADALGDVSGYLPGKLQEAAEDLRRQLPLDLDAAHAQLLAVHRLLRDEMETRYNSFNIGIELDSLIAIRGADELNEYLDECVENGNGELLEDIFYRLAGTDVDMVIIEVTANTRYLENQLEEE